MTATASSAAPSTRPSVVTGSGWFERRCGRRTRTRTSSAGSAASAAECLDRLLIFNRRQLERSLRVYVRHYNQQRPHRALALKAPDPPPVDLTRGGRAGSAMAIRRRDLLGGLIHEYEATAP